MRGVQPFSSWTSTFPRQLGSGVGAGIAAAAAAPAAAGGAALLGAEALALPAAAPPPLPPLAPAPKFRCGVLEEDEEVLTVCRVPVTPGRRPASSAFTAGMFIASTAACRSVRCMERVFTGVLGTPNSGASRNVVLPLDEE
jgi:hypothetical protein